MLRNLVQRMIEQRAAAPEPQVALDDLFKRKRNLDRSPKPVAEVTPEPVAPKRKQARTWKSPDFLSDMLRGQDNVPPQSRLGENFVHVSSLCQKDFCPRAHVLATRQKQTLYNRHITGGHKVMWALGRAAEKHVRNSIIAARDFKGVLGRWLCRCEDSQVDGLHNADLVCSRCGSGLDTYKELPLLYAEYGVVGSCDLPLLINNEVCLTEIKSYLSDEPPKHPIADHIFQLASYYKLWKETTEYRVSPLIRFLYVSKRFKYGSPYVEFLLDLRSDDYIENAIEIGWSIATEIKEHLEAGTLPERPCPNAQYTRAKNCSVSVPCFWEEN